MKNRHHFLFLLIVLLSLCSLIFSNDLRTIIFEQVKIDSIGHFIGFFCLSLLLNSLLKLPLFNTVICLIFYAALSEIGQYYLGFRNGEFRDVVADILGVLLFTLLKWTYVVYWQKNVLWK